MAKRLNLHPEITNTITTPEALLAELDRVRKDEVGVDKEEFVDGMIAVAVLIKDLQGRFYAAVVVHAPVVRMSLKSAREFIPRLRDAATELALLLES